MDKKTLVLGASLNPQRYSNKAIKALLSKGHSVEALGKKEGSVDGINVFTSPKPLKDIHTVTLYLNPNNQKDYYNYIISLNPKRIVFNPGAENPEFAKIASSRGIEPIYGCTLVMLSVGKY